VVKALAGQMKPLLALAKEMWLIKMYPLLKKLLKK